MNKKTKLIALIASFCMMLTLLAVGVFALGSATVPMGGQINFKADGINATISQGSLTGGKLGKTETGTEMWENVATSGKLQEIVYSTTQSKVEDNTSTWDGLYLHYDEGQTEMTIAFTITNEGTSPLYVKITTPEVPDGMTITPVSNLSGDTYTDEIASGMPEMYFIVFTVIDEMHDIIGEGFIIDITLSSVKPAELQPQMKAGSETEVDYYYVTMGTYNEEPIRWRYLGYVDNGNYISSTTPVKGKQGVFVLETFVGQTMKFSNSYQKNVEENKFYHTDNGLTNVYANDYATSNIRSFLIGETVKDLGTYNSESVSYSPSGNDIDLLSVYGIQKDDPVYASIVPRTLEDLYSQMGTNGEKEAYPSDIKVPSKGTKDKLWLMSLDEVYTFMGQGSKVEGKIPENWSEDVRARTIWNGQFYWLRTRDSADETNLRMSLVGNQGGWAGLSSGGVDKHIRPSFLLWL